MYVCTSKCAYARPISYVLIQDFARYYLFLAYNEQNRYVCMWLLGEGCMYVCVFVGVYSYLERSVILELFLLLPLLVMMVMEVMLSACCGVI